jgi:hypothetical protein
MQIDFRGLNLEATAGVALMFLSLDGAFRISAGNLNFLIMNFLNGYACFLVLVEKRGAPFELLAQKSNVGKKKIQIS